MGRAKQHWMDAEAMNLQSVPDKSICVDHINEKEIKKFIKKNYEEGFCDYCRKERKVVHLEDLMEFMMGGINEHFGDAANFLGYDSREGGYLGTTFDENELIQDYIQLETDPFEVTQDIVNAMAPIAWAKPDDYYETDDDIYFMLWHDFKEVIKHRSRHLFYQGEKNNNIDPYSILKDIGKMISKHRLFRTLKSGQLFYRCRQEQSRLQKDLKQFVAPPTEFANFPNRFSPAGISMLYTATDPDTSLLETVNTKNLLKPQVSLATLQLDTEVLMIDLTRLPEMPSVFKPNQSTEANYLIGFLRGLVRDMTLPVSKDGKEHIDYVPTQVVTEFFRYPFNKNRKSKVWGIIYPSSKNEGKETQVFFWDHNECLENLFLKVVKYDTIKAKCFDVKFDI